jgi:hypothetical protein
VGNNLDIFPDNFYYAIEFFENLIIPKSEYLKTLSLEPFLPRQVFLLLQSMVAPVNFYDDLSFERDKINDVIP